MINGKYLTDAINLDEIEIGCLNLISSNCGSGKTTFALNKLTELANSLDKVLYLIDSCGGRDQILKNENTKNYDKFVDKIVSGEMVNFESEKIVVMTYAKFGYILKYNPNFAENFELIICDELHRLPEIVTWDIGRIKKQHPLLNKKEINFLISKSSAAYLAMDAIQNYAVNSLNTLGTHKLHHIVALTATPRKVYEQFGFIINEVVEDVETVAYETFKEIEYKSIAITIANLKAGTRGIIFTSRITDIEKFMEMATKRGFCCKALWSIHNKDHIMTEEQIRIRKHIIEEQKIPDDIDILFINKSYETSINIFTPLEWMIIHDSDPDVRIQARNRYRGDLGELYVYNPNLKDNCIELPDEWLDKPLTVADKKELCQAVHLKDKRGVVVGWTTVKKKLIECGYKIQETKRMIDGTKKNVSIITI